MDAPALDADLPQALVRVLLDQMLFELEVGDDEARELCAACCAKLGKDPRFARFWRPRFCNLVMECARSPGINHTLAACPTRFLGPLFVTMERAAAQLRDSGASGFKDLVGRTPDHLVGFLRHGAPAYRVLDMVLFPTTASTAAALSQEVANALAASCERDPEAVQPYLSRAVEAALAAAQANKAPLTDVWTLVTFLQQLLGGSGDASAAVVHPHMAALVRATRGLQGVPARKPWLQGLAAAACKARSLTAPAMRTLAAALAVDQSLCLQLVAEGALLTKRLKKHKSADSALAASELACALVEAYSQIRALPELLSAVCTPPASGSKGASTRSMLVRDVLGRPEAEAVRRALRDALRACLPALAGALALVPWDAVSAQLVCDVLRWGPIGPEAVSAGWDPCVWAAALCSHVGVALAQQRWSEAHRVHCALLDAVHYRWSPLQAAAVLPRAPSRAFFCLVTGDAISVERLQQRPDCENPAFLRYCWLRLRLARDFSQHWPLDTADAEALSLWLLQQSEPGGVDWAVLLWAGGVAALQMWMRIADEGSGGFSVSALDAAWRLEPERAVAVAEALLELPLARACRLAALLPMDLVALCGASEADAATAVRALTRVGRGAVLAALVAGPAPVWRRVATALWVREKLLLGPEVASVLAGDAQQQRIWDAVLRLARPEVWAYAAAAAMHGPEEQLAACARLLVAAGPAAWREEQGCWQAWSAVLARVQQWPLWVQHVGPAVGSVFGAACQDGQWGVLEALHGALHRLGCDGWACAARATLALLAGGRVPEDAAPSLLAAAVGPHYEVALQAALGDRSCRVLRAALELGPAFHDVPLLRDALPRLLELVQQQAGGAGGSALASRCVERSIRLAPPYNATQLGTRLLSACRQDSPASVRACMAVLSAARKVQKNARLALATCAHVRTRAGLPHILVPVRRPGGRASVASPARGEPAAGGAGRCRAGRLGCCGARRGPRGGRWRRGSQGSASASR